MDVQAARKRAKALIAQATDESVTIDEARSHSHAAAKIIAKYGLLDEVVPDLMGQVLTPEVGEAVGAVVDLVGRFSKSGIADALKRAVGTTRRAAASTRRGRETNGVPAEGRRRRHER